MKKPADWPVSHSAKVDLGDIEFAARRSFILRLMPRV